MEKTLFISDLDGTLLNNSGELTKYTVNIINSLISGGMHFTFATARTIYSAKVITSGLDINVPCILNNGASVYDMQTGSYVRNNYINPDTAGQIVSAFRTHGVNCFLFKFIGNEIAVHYDRISDENMQRYIDERKGKFGQSFVECADISGEIDSRIIYINCSGEYESLLPVRNAVLDIGGADCAFYKDTYTEKWYLETFSDRASKANGIKYLRENYGFTRVVAFGDNLNDLSMFRQADIKIAVGNAKSELRESADFVIGTNENNGVAEWLAENYGGNYGVFA